MESFLNWLETLDWNNICAAIWSFVCVYGVSLFGLIIGILKLKVKNANFYEKLEETKLIIEKEYAQKIEELYDKFNGSIEKMKDTILTENSKLNQEKIEAVNNAIETAKETIENISPIEEKEKSIDDLLKELN